MDNTLKLESTIEEKQYIVVNIGVEQYGIPECLNPRNIFMVSLISEERSYR